MKLRPLMLLVVLFSLALSSCATLGEIGLPAAVDAEVYLYDGDLPIYPAIYAVLSDSELWNWQYAYLDAADIYQDTYVIKRGYARDGSSDSLFTYSISEADGNISFDVSDVRQNGKTFSRFLLYNPQILHNQFISRANQIMNDPDQYTAAKRAALTDGTFLRLIFNQMTDIQRDIFFKNEFSGQTWTFAGTFNDIDRVETGRYVDDYKYKIQMSVSYPAPGAPAVPVGSEFIREPESHAVLLYTNDDSYVSLSRGTEIELTGTVVLLGYSEADLAKSYFHIELLD
jgi:hypothetical protein